MAHTYHGPSGRYVDSSHSRQRRPSYQPYGEDEAIHAYPERFTYDVPNVRSQRMTSHQDRPEYVGRRTTRAIVHDTSRNTDKERKRISVACVRCRKRKIKCSGELPGEGSCAACKHAGYEGASCTFIRVKATEISFVSESSQSSGVLTASGSPITPSSSTIYNEGIPCSTGNGYDCLSRNHRPSLPSLGAIACDGYQEDVTLANYGSENHLRQHAGNAANFRSWSDTLPMSSASTASHYQPTAGYGYGYDYQPMHHSTYQLDRQQQQPRLPSLTGDAYGPFQMSRMQSSLPSHAMHERRLPVPAFPSNTALYPPIQGHFPPARPLGSYSEPSVQMRGFYGQRVPSLSYGSNENNVVTHAESTYAVPVNSYGQSAAPMLQSSYAHHWDSMRSNGLPSSPEISPVSATPTSGGYSSTSTSDSIHQPYDLQISVPAANMAYANLFTTTSATDGQYSSCVGFPHVPAIANEHSSSYTTLTQPAYPFPASITPHNALRLQTSMAKEGHGLARPSAGSGHLQEIESAGDTGSSEQSPSRSETHKRRKFGAASSHRDRMSVANLNGEY